MRLRLSPLTFCLLNNNQSSICKNRVDTQKAQGRNPQAHFQIDMKPQVVKYMIEAEKMSRAVAFYRDTLGLDESFSSPYWSELSFNGAIIGIHGGGSKSEKSTGLSLQYENVQEAFSQAIEGGATSVEEPHSREGEPIILSSIRDTEGNLLMLTQYVG